MGQGATRNMLPIVPIYGTMVVPRRESRMIGRRLVAAGGACAGRQCRSSRDYSARRCDDTDEAGFARDSLRQNGNAGHGGGATGMQAHEAHVATMHRLSHGDWWVCLHRSRRFSPPSGLQRTPREVAPLLIVAHVEAVDRTHFPLRSGGAPTDYRRRPARWPVHTAPVPYFYCLFVINRCHKTLPLPRTLSTPSYGQQGPR